MVNFGSPLFDSVNGMDESSCFGGCQLLQFCATVLMYSRLGDIYHVPATRRKSACHRSSQVQQRFEGMIA